MPLRACLLRHVALGGLVVLCLVLTQAHGHSYVIAERWADESLPVTLNLGSLSSFWRRAAIEAVGAWNDAASRPLLNWGSSRAAFRCGQRDGRNDVLWQRTHCGRAWGSNTLAIATSWRNPETCARVESDVAFNSTRKWNIYYGTHRTSGGEVFDLRRVAVHEFGHVLGLKHPDEYGQRRVAIMNSTSPYRDRLQTDDIEGVNDLYSSPGRCGADLLVDLRVNDSMLTPNQEFTLAATVHNIGTEKSPATRLRYYYWRASQRLRVVVGYDDVDSIDPAQSSYEAHRVTAPASPGTYFYAVCVTPGTEERHKDNNCTDWKAVDVEGGTPDLEVQSLQASAGTVGAGQAFALSATVRNVGDAPSEEATLRYYHWQESSRRWMVVGSGRIGTLASGGSGQNSLRLNAPSTAGEHVYAACVSVVRGERNRQNCGNRVRVTVRRGRDRPSVVTISGHVADGRHEQVVIWGAIAEVRNRATGLVVRARTGADGRYAISLATSGTYTVSVRAGGYGAQSREVTIAGGTTIDFTLERIYPGFPSATGTISGTFDYSATSIFRDIADAGRADECWSSYLFNVRLSDGWSARVQVDSSLGDLSTARRHARGMGETLGLTPAVLRSKIQWVCLHDYEDVSNNYAIRGQGMVYYLPGREANRLAAITLHEGAHASLDSDHYPSPGWRAAVEADGNFITEYAREVPTGEDIAESFVAYFQALYSRNITDEDVRQVLLTIPNRIEYFEAQRFDMRPWSSRLRSLTVTPGPVRATWCDRRWTECRND